MDNGVPLDPSRFSASFIHSDPDLQAGSEWFKSFVQTNQQNLIGFQDEEGRNWAKLLIGEDGGLSWMHGGEFLTGAALMSFTTFSVPFAAAGGIIADTATLPFKGMDAMPGCITCKVLGEGYVKAYRQEYEEFIEPSVPGQIIFNPTNEWLESKGLFPPASTWPSPFEIFDWSGSHFHQPTPPLDPDSWLRPREVPSLPSWRF
jgi:hypothetical protein